MVVNKILKNHIEIYRFKQYTNVVNKKSKYSGIIIIIIKHFKCYGQILFGLTDFTDEPFQQLLLW